MLAPEFFLDGQHVLPDPDQHLVKFVFKFVQCFAPVAYTAFFFSRQLAKGFF